MHVDMGPMRRSVWLIGC